MFDSTGVYQWTRLEVKFALIMSCLEALDLNIDRAAALQLNRSFSSPLQKPKRLHYQLAKSPALACPSHQTPATCRERD